jgi:hypothetical protein
MRNRTFLSDGWFLLGIGLAGLVLVMFRRAWILSQNGGFALFSRQTWEAFRIYAIFAAVFIIVRLAWYFATRKEDGGSDES